MMRAAMDSARWRCSACVRATSTRAVKAPRAALLRTSTDSPPPEPVRRATARARSSDDRVRLRRRPLAVGAGAVAVPRPAPAHARRAAAQQAQPVRRSQGCRVQGHHPHDHSRPVQRAAFVPAAAGGGRRVPSAAGCRRAAAFSSTAQRTSKPFNPLLGETFELLLPERGLALVAEQVSHHPPMSAVFAAGNGWTYHTAHRVKNKFLVNAMEAWPDGTVHIHFDDGDHFMYDKPHTFINNLFFGNMWIDIAGHVTIRNSHFVASLHMKRACTGPFREGKGLGNTVGSVFSAADRSRKPLHKIVANWTSHAVVDGSEVWRMSPKPPSSHTASSSFTAWAWSLNAPLESDEAASVPKTDSRRRPDQRALEKGDHKLASSEKARLEDAQRARRQASERENKLLQPQWFELRHEPSTGRKEWKYGRQYFRRKRDATGIWPDRSPDIF
ncbi:Oxysterol-binding protein [Gracilaria domingensis]|nr:Oxysterol-binding protein [Gracilaria domingensis]